MFEGIHFQESQSLIPLTEKNYPLVSDHFFGSNAGDMKETYSFAVNGEFAIDGPNRTSSHPMVSQYAMDHYFYIQSFTIFESYERYFTRRSGFSTYLLSLTLKGEGRLSYAGAEYILQPNQMFFIDCRHPHCYQTEGKYWKHADLHLKGAYTDMFFRCCQDQAQFIFSFDQALLTEIEQLLQADQRVDACRELLVSSRIDHLLAEIISSSAGYQHQVEAAPEALSELLLYIESNYSKPLTLDLLAKISGFSKPHLIRLFDQYLGTSPMNYVIDYRLGQAKELLSHTNLPVSGIGECVGIPDASYFCSLFKKRVGMTPAGYRKRQQAD